MTTEYAPTKSSNRILVVIPARNEARSIARVIESIRACVDWDILVVDDKSHDETASAARNAGARVISLHFHHGAWNAVQTGFRFSLDRRYDYVVTMDADGQHRAEYLRPLLAPVEERIANTSIGLCLDRSTLPKRLAGGAIRALSGLDIEDITSGFRAYDRAAIRCLLGPSATLLDYQDVGVLILLRNAGLRTVEVRVPMSARRDGASRIYHSWAAIYTYLLQTLLLCVAKISPGWARPESPLE